MLHVTSVALITAIVIIFVPARSGWRELGGAGYLGMWFMAPYVGILIFHFDWIAQEVSPFLFMLLFSLSVHTHPIIYRRFNVSCRVAIPALTSRDGNVSMLVGWSFQHFVLDLNISTTARR